MTLGGLSVEDWMRVCETARSQTSSVANDPVQDGPQAERMPRVARLRGAVTWATALAVGMMLALLALHADIHCPADGEGMAYCNLQHHVLRAIMTFLLVSGAIVALQHALWKLPDAIARVRREGLLPRPPSAGAYGDALLIAASRGIVS